MKVEQILKQLTPERIKKEVEAIQKTELPPELQKWVKEYEKVGQRDEFIWKWLYRMFEAVKLPGVRKKHEESLRRIKVLMTMFVVLLDDIADKEQSKSLLNKLLKIPLRGQDREIKISNKEDYKHFLFTRKVWNYIEKAIKKYPYYKEIEEVFYYDTSQVLNAINFSLLVNKNPYLINQVESWQYLSFNMVSFLYSDLDFMCYKEFKKDKIGKVRGVIFYAQKMARIGNWLSTWEREIKEGDLSNGMIAYALDRNLFTLKELKKKHALKIIKRIKKTRVEKKLFKEWENSYNFVKNSREIRDKKFIEKFLSSLERLLILHLISKGYK